MKSDLEHLVNTYHENEELKATLNEIDSASNEVSDLKKKIHPTSRNSIMKNSIKSVDYPLMLLLALLLHGLMS